MSVREQSSRPKQSQRIITGDPTLLPLIRKLAKVLSSYLHRRFGIIVIV